MFQSSFSSLLVNGLRLSCVYDTKRELLQLLLSVIAFYANYHTVSSLKHSEDHSSRAEGYLLRDPGDLKRLEMESDNSTIFKGLERPVIFSLIQKVPIVLIQLRHSQE